jgi:hypothetical protein
MLNVCGQILKFHGLLRQRRRLNRNCFLHDARKSLQQLTNLQAFTACPALISFL